MMVTSNLFSKKNPTFFSFPVVNYRHKKMKAKVILNRLYFATQQHVILSFLSTISCFVTGKNIECVLLYVL